MLPEDFFELEAHYHGYCPENLFEAYDDLEQEIKDFDLRFTWSEIAILRFLLSKTMWVPDHPSGIARLQVNPKFCGQKVIASMNGTGDRTVNRALKSLEDRGFIGRGAQYKGQQRIEDDISVGAGRRFRAMRWLMRDKGLDADAAYEEIICMTSEDLRRDETPSQI